MKLREELELNIGLLRQWLNERTDDKLITNEIIKVFISPERIEELFQKYAEEMVGEDNNTINQNYEDDIALCGYNRAKAEIRERIKQLSE